MHGAARWSRYPSDSSRTARSGPATRPRRRAALVLHHHHYPIGARALPASRVRKIIPIRSALGVLPVSHGRTAHYLSSGAHDPARCPLSDDHPVRPALGLRPISHGPLSTVNHQATGPCPLASRRAARWWAGCMEVLAGPGILRTHLGRHGAGPQRVRGAEPPWSCTTITTLLAPGPCPLAVSGRSSPYGRR